MTTPAAMITHLAMAICIHKGLKGWGSSEAQVNPSNAEVQIKRMHVDVMVIAALL